MNHRKPPNVRSIAGTGMKNVVFIETFLNNILDDNYGNKLTVIMIPNKINNNDADIMSYTTCC